MKRTFLSLCALAVVCFLPSLTLTAEKPKMTGGSTLPVTTKKPIAGQLQAIPKPDLMPTRIWVNQADCRLWVEWKNQGAAAPNKTWTEHITLSGSFRHGSTAMTNYSFDSRNGFAIPANYMENHGVTHLYPIFIAGKTKITLIVDGTNVHVEENEANNTMSKEVACTNTIK